MAEQPNQHGDAPPSSAARSSPGLSRVRRFDGSSLHTTSSVARASPSLTLAESWVELASQPSSSSLSSIDDHIVTTGLRVSGLHGRRRRSSQQGGPAAARSVPQQQDTAIHDVVQANVHSSSQEEYDEDESESESELEEGDDRIMSSSAENVQPSSSDLESDEEESDDGDDDDAATALGRASDGPVFRPQPNAFSHPPASGPQRAPQRSHSATSSMPPHPHSGFTRPSFSQRSQTRVHRGGPSFMSPSVREDNDAALRASLTTLLSCAAAARGLPKSKADVETQARQATRNGVGPSTQPMELRLVPESELMDESAQTQRGNDMASPGRRASPSRSSGKSKRGDSVGRSPRASKKKRTVVGIPTAGADETLISPTLMTWVVSAGVVVLVSVVGFGAGYVIGREVGRQEVHETLTASLSSANETTKYGSEVIRSSGGGLRRLRWGAVGKSIVAQA